MVTGDNERTAAWIAEQTGIQKVHAGVMPGDKAHLVAGAPEGMASRSPLSAMGSMTPLP